MSTDPIRLLEDPGAALELREFMLGQERPDTLPQRQRESIERRISASALALPVSMKLGGLFSQGSTTAGAATTSSASGVGGVASASVAPAATSGALGATSLTLASAKGVLVGTLSVTKGAAVLGVALATGAGASYVVQDAVFARASSGSISEPAVTLEAADRSGKQFSRPIRRGSPAHGKTESPLGAAAAPTSTAPQGESMAGKGAELSLEDLEDVLHAADEGAQGSRASSGARTARVERAALPGRVESPNASERLREEVELLRRAQQLLRVDRALAADTLERYDTKFPNGAMRAEYDVLRRRLLARP